MAGKSETRVDCQPQYADVLEAAERIGAHVHRTPVMRCHTLDRMTGATLFLKAENLQRTGSFKFRGACNAVGLLSHDERRCGVVTHSSGNHAAALARAAQMYGAAAHIVMPEGSNPAKSAAVGGYGGKITWCDNSDAARRNTANRIKCDSGATFIHPYNDWRIIAGQGTCALELLDEVKNLDLIMAPVGGGGLLAGTCVVCGHAGGRPVVIGAEPELADDTYRSVQTGTLQPQCPPLTVADGLRTGLGPLNFAIIRHHVQQIVLAGEQEILEAMRLIWERAKLVIEPSAAVVVAAALGDRIDLAGRRVGMILSGGNVELCRNRMCHYWQ